MKDPGKRDWEFFDAASTTQEHGFQNLIAKIYFGTRGSAFFRRSRKKRQHSKLQLPRRAKRHSDSPSAEPKQRAKKWSEQKRTSPSRYSLQLQSFHRMRIKMALNELLNVGQKALSLDLQIAIEEQFSKDLTPNN